MIDGLYKQTEVENGMYFLDETRPNWADEIDLDILDLGDSNCCILGQLCDSYDNGQVELEINSDECRGFGFTLYGLHAGEDFEALTDTWKQLIQARYH